MYVSKAGEKKDNDPEYYVRFEKKRYLRLLIYLCIILYTVSWYGVV